MKGCNNHDDHRVGQRGEHHGDAATWRNPPTRSTMASSAFQHFSISAWARVLRERPAACDALAITEAFVSLMPLSISKGTALGTGRQHNTHSAGWGRYPPRDSNTHDGTCEKLGEQGAGGRCLISTEERGHAVLACMGAYSRQQAAGSADGVQHVMECPLATPSRKRRRLMAANARATSTLGTAMAAVDERSDSKCRQH